MIVLISLGIIALVGLLWWWVVNPTAARQKPARDVPLPLYTTRTSHRAGVIVPAMASVTAAPPAPAAPLAAPTPPPERPAEEEVRSVPRPLPKAGVTFERVFRTEPWVEPDVAASSSDARGPSNGGSRSPSSSNGHEAVTDRVAASPPPPPPRPARTVAPRSRAPARRIAAPEVAEAERWGPPTVRDPSATVQFLPGRLEVLQGRSMEGQEIRFVRPDRPAERAVVTFGRGEGAPYRHVQLKVPTVSRLHARMSQEPGDDAWSLENLSSTNPVAVNGMDLTEGGDPVVLADGDRVEMGEVVFVFRAR